MKIANTAVASGAPRVAKPQPNIDRKALRAQINKQFSKTLEYLGK